ncbi:MAG TPA: hypothetical protein VEY71_04845 [Chitinophagales bacterium]|nr:hypothetical protein [Chitinophagales bacterium]
MTDTLNQLKNVTSACCVTIVMNTHRTKPDNLQDPIRLKNLVREADQRMQTETSKDIAKAVSAKLHALVDEINHDYNLDGLALFVNEDMAVYERLPVTVQDRVVIHSTFATRDLLRALHEQESYYVLVLSRERARMIEASNDKVVAELTGAFPIDNTEQITHDRTDYARDKDADRLIEQFFNIVDKAVQQVRSTKPLPVVLYTEERNHAFYMNVCDNKASVIGHVLLKQVNERATAVVADAWPVVHEANRAANQKRMDELRNAPNGTFLSDVNDIWRAINEGRGKTLFVKKGFIQPGRINGDVVETVEDVATADRIGLVDDLVDEMIELNTRFGGDAVFLSDGELADFQGLALVTRY